MRHDLTGVASGGSSTHELHPLCTLFPRMGGSEFAALVADIRANGLREPIVLHDGMILDGGNRYRACQEAGVEPTFQTFAGGNLVLYVLSANLHRRHMTPGQQAAIVAAAQDWAQAHAAGSNQHAPRAGGPAILPDLSGAAILPDLATVADRAAQSGASERTQRMADKVAKADPELARSVAQGEVTLPAAVQQVTGKRPGAKIKPLSEVDRLKLEVARLSDELAESREACSVMADELKARGMADDPDVENRIRAVLEQLRAVEATRDDYMRQNAQLKREVAGLRRKLGDG